MFKKSAYTIIEIVVVVAMIGLLSTVGILSFNSGQSNFLLQAETDRFVGTLRELQTKTFNNLTYNGIVPLGGYGIHFTNADPITYLGTTYDIFIRNQNVSGPFSSSTDTIIESYQLPKDFYWMMGETTYNFKAGSNLVEENGSNNGGAWSYLGYLKVRDYYQEIFLNNITGAVTVTSYNEANFWATYYGL